MELRHYQQQAIDEVKQHFSNGHKKVLMQMPTGAGKTVTFAHIVKGAIFKGKKVLILAHRRELISQAFKTLQRLGIPAGVIMSGYNPDASQAVQIGSIQTIIRRLDIIKLEFDLIIVDECHHAMAKSFGSIFARYPNAYILGVTATPCRVDGKGLGDIFSKLVHGLQISELIEMGSLISPNYYCVPSHSLDTIHEQAGDYNVRELEELREREVWLSADLIETWHKEAFDLQTIVFAISVKHSKEVAQMYQDSGVSAIHLDAETPQEQRNEIITKFANKEIKVLCNVGIFTEGFDVPSISCVQLARPTKSLSLYYQMIGRSLRPCEGKTEAVILDHVGAYDTHGSVVAARMWNLETTKKKKAKADSFESEYKEPIACIDGSIQLVSIGSGVSSEWLKSLDELIRRAVKTNYAKGWVVHEFLKLYPDPELVQAQVLGRALGYHHKWVSHFMEKVVLWGSLDKIHS